MEQQLGILRDDAPLNDAPLDEANRTTFDPATSPVAAYLLTVSPATGRTAKAHLATIAQMAGWTDIFTAPWEELTFTHTQAIRNQLVEKYPPATCNVKLSTLRNVLKCAWRMGKMETDQYLRATDIAPVRGERVPKGRAASNEDLAKLFEDCRNDTDATGARDAAILAIMVGAGLRREEVYNLRINDYNTASGELRVLGKGNKERIVYTTNGGKMAMDAWVRARNSIMNPKGVETRATEDEDGNEDNDRLFCRIDRWNNMHSGISGMAIYNMLEKRCESAGIEVLRPHDLRRTYITGMLDKGIDIKTVADLAGHSKLDTTAGYDRRGESAKLAACEQLHVPYLRE